MVSSPLLVASCVFAQAPTSDAEMLVLQGLRVGWMGCWSWDDDINDLVGSFPKISFIKRTSKLNFVVTKSVEEALEISGDYLLECSLGPI